MKSSSLENITRIEALLQRGPYDSLEKVEQELIINVLGSAAEFDAMRKVGQALDAYTTDFSPDSSVLQALEQTFRQHQDRRAHVKDSRRYGFLTFRVPAYAAALAMVLCSVFTGLIVRQKPAAPNTLAVINPDTIFIKAQSDTVVVEKVIYKTIEVPRKAVENTVANVQSHEPEAPIGAGVSMKENEELEKLLVSGTN